jgi:protein subunit release factor B
MSQLLFSVTIKDCDVQTFRAGGKGGQHQNKVESGVRIIHRASGAVGEGREDRSQLVNKRRAFARMARSETFQRWHRLETSRRLGVELIERGHGHGRASYGVKYVRTYDFCDREVKDSVTGVVRRDVGRVMNGDIDAFIAARRRLASAGSAGASSM